MSGAAMSLCIKVPQEFLNVQFNSCAGVPVHPQACLELASTYPAQVGHQTGNNNMKEGSGSSTPSQSIQHIDACISQSI
eukprot:1158243-Amphidinium_carterae.1